MVRDCKNVVIGGFQFFRVTGGFLVGYESKKLSLYGLWTGLPEVFLEIVIKLIEAR